MANNDAAGAVVLVLFAIIIFVVIGVPILLDVFLHNPVGSIYIKETIQKQSPTNGCDLSHFITEYGNVTLPQNNTLHIENDTYSIINFNSGWVAPVYNGNNGKCYFEENEAISKLIFQDYAFNNSIQKISKNFYSPFITCNRKYKGREVVCEITSQIYNISGSTTVELVAKIPEELFEKSKKSLVNTGWELLSEVGINSVKLAKTIQSGTTFYAIITLVKTTSCSLTNSNLVSVFDFANDINQSYSDAYTHIFSNSTTQKITKTNYTMALLYELDSKNKDLFEGVISGGSNFLAGENQCNEFKPLDEIKKFQDSTVGFEESSAKFNSDFLEKIKYFKSKAQEQLLLEEKSKNENYPNFKNIDKLAKITKVMEYLVYDSGSNLAFREQEYENSKIKAIEGANYYNSFWETRTSGIDYLPGFFILVIILGSIFAIILLSFIKKLEE